MLLRFPTLCEGLNLTKVPDTWLIVLRLTGLGWFVAVSIILGVVGGLGLDRLLGTTPLFILLGTVLGSVVAFWGLLKMVTPVLNSVRRNDAGIQGSKRPGSDC
jgi:hypothetical protein